jgi:hypothetical protein
MNYLAPAVIENDENIQRRKVEGSDGKKSIAQDTSK